MTSRIHAWPLTAIGCAAILAACGGGGGNSAPGATVENASAACSALTGRTVDASLIGEPSTGAIVKTATYKTAVADAPNSANNAIVQGLPDYCELQVQIKPVDSSAPLINSQINLPRVWNGKKLQFGGSGYNGSLVVGVNGLGPARVAGPDVALPLTQGYMTAGTDSGHQNDAPLGAFALNAEALANFGYASYKKTHDVTLQLGAIFYGKRPARSYYMGGSEGGREAMMMAQRYPNDYDGIISVDPVMNWTGLQTFGSHVGGTLQAVPNGWLGQNTKWQLVHDTVRDACDALDGLADNVVSNYRACKPVALPALEAKRCASGGDEGTSCFSDAQLAVVRAAYNGLNFSFPRANGLTSYAGFGFGGEGLPGNWDRWMAGTANPNTGPIGNGATGTNPIAISRLYEYGNVAVRYFFAQNKDFNPLGFDPATYSARIQAISSIMDATNPDLSAFQARGGKLILREDMSDNAQSGFTGLNYWDAVVDKLGRDRVEQFFVAYAATGLTHTSGGIAAGTTNAPTYGIPGRVDLLTQLDAWVEKGSKPADQLTLTNNAALPPYAAITAKPMCRYPQFPRYTAGASGDPKLAASYTCAAN